MKRTATRALAVAAAIFVSLLGLRITYGYLSHPATPPHDGYGVLGGGGGFALETRNYASSKRAAKGSKGGSGDVIGGGRDQKYEKIARLQTRSDDFPADEQALRGTIGAHGGLIQHEARSGLGADRQLQLAVGVAPTSFDTFLADARAIGVVRSLTVQKTDKTNDYRELQAQRASLEKTRSSLRKLQGTGDRLDDAIRLEERILEIEERIQRLGISLGEFDVENEFCTVMLTLTERAAPATGIPFWQRAKVALEWTVPIYLRLMAALLLAVVAALGTTLTVQRFRAVQDLLRSAAAAS